jgi:acyl-[acyl-carrier-protein]-phospholipid O-acyltransferase/long-chain-fatty-acid--[acyl-carrier-protein] ligase
MRTFFRLLLRVLFRFRACNQEALNVAGPVLLVPNHVSWLDWLFIWVCLDDRWRVVTSRLTAETSWLHRRIMINRHTLPIDPASPYAVKRMAEFLQGGGRLVLFAEGRLSRTGDLMKLFDGTGFLIFKTKAKVITAHLRGAERLPFSPNPGWKRCFPTVTVHFSAVLVAPEAADPGAGRARARLTGWLRDQLVRQQFEVEMAFGAADVLAAVAETARQQPGFIILEDTTFQTLTYRKLMLGAGVLAEGLRDTVGDGARIGVLLPNVNATPVTILALWSLGKVPALLNYSAGTPTMLACAELAGLKHLITSRAFLERARLNAGDFQKAGLKVICLEDVRGGITGRQKIRAVLRHRFHRRPAGGPAPATGATAVVVFTSGSEGVPKGVELTHGNLLANIRQMLAVTDLTDCDRLFNCLPLFHSFGLTAGTLLPLVRGIFVFLHPSPLRYRQVPAMLYERDCTVFISTNTFLNGYARKAHPYDFRSLRYLFSAAEKLQEATALAWSRKYGVRILEGYGATECAPCISLRGHGVRALREFKHAAGTTLWVGGPAAAGDGIQTGAGRRRGGGRAAAGARSQRDEGVPERGGQRTLPGAGRLVRHGRHREPGCRRLPADPGPVEALRQSKRRDGEPHGGGGRTGGGVSELRAALPDRHCDAAR